MANERGGRGVQQFRDGEVIVPSGAFCREALLVLEGEVEIHDPGTDGTRPFAVLSEGNVFGDVFVIRPGVCPFEVRARGNARVRRVESTEIQEILTDIARRGAAGGVAATAVRRLAWLCDRRMGDEAGDFLTPVEVTSLEPSSDCESGAAEGLRLLVEWTPVTVEARAALGGRESVRMSRLPALVGRRSRSMPSEAADSFADVLLLDDAAPYQISRRHLVLRQESGNLVFEDAGSRLGSMVQQTRIGGRDGVRALSVGPGTYDLALGNAQTPYRFKVAVMTTSSNA